MTQFSVHYLGTSAAVPTADRGLAATAVRHEGHTLLIDCGEGTQRQLRRSALGLVELDAIAFTHFHGDHYLGLIGLLKSYDLLGRRTPLHLWGPAGLTSLLDLLSPVIGPLAYEVRAEELAAGDTVRPAGSSLQITPFATRHAVASLGYRIAEPQRPGRFDVRRARALGLRPGPDFAALQHGRSVVQDGRTVVPEEVLGPARPGRSLVLTGDTEPCPETIEAADGVDVLVHEATFVGAERRRARATRHSCADEAARVAASARVGRLVLTHLSPRTAPREALAEARSLFPDVVVPDDLDVHELPLRS